MAKCRCFAIDDGQTDTLAQPCSLLFLPCLLGMMSLIRSLKVAPRTPVVSTVSGTVILQAKVHVMKEFAVFGCPSSCTGTCGTFQEMGAAEGADARGIPHQHPALAEGEDGDAVWPVSGSAGEAPRLKDCPHIGCAQGLAHITEGCMVRQMAWISPAEQVVVVQPVHSGIDGAAGWVCLVSVQSLCRLPCQGARGQVS